MVKLVVNHDVPQTSTDYIHRVGRTARAGRGGMAVTFVTQYDVQLVQSIEEKINVKLTALPIKEDEALENLNDVTEAKRKAIMSMSESNFGEKKRRNKEKHSNSDGSSSSSSKEGSTNVTHVAKKVRKEKS